MYSPICMLSIMDKHQKEYLFIVFFSFIIFLDLIMPVKDGFQTLEALKADPSAQNIPIYVLSNLGQEEDIEKALSLGASGYFNKSDTPLATLTAKVKELFE